MPLSDTFDVKSPEERKQNSSSSYFNAFVYILNGKYDFSE
jgi:hypothetical protein